MNLRRWIFWRRGEPTAPAIAAPSPRKSAHLYGAVEAVQAGLAWLLPGSAVVVAALGQFALAVVLCVVAFGIWLRLWRGRVRERRAGRRG